MIQYIENLKYATRKILELINEFGKVAGYKVNIQKLVAFLYTNKYQKEKVKKKSGLKSHPPPTKTWNKTRMLTVTNSIQHSIGRPSHSYQIRKRNKSCPHWKKRGKTVIIGR